jgi:hypothetical protein
MFTAWSPMRSRSFEDLEGRGDEAQVARQRLLQREQLHARLLDVDLHAVDHAIIREHLVGERGIAAHEGLDGLADDALRVAAHEEQLLVETVDLLVETAMHDRVLSSRVGMAGRADQPKRPVM